MIKISKNEDMIFAYCDDNPVGYMDISDFPYITAFVEPKYRRRGIFNDMLKTCIEEMRDCDSLPENVSLIIGFTENDTAKSLENAGVISYLYADTLMELNEEVYKKNCLKNTDDYNGCFSDSYEDYLLYRDIENDDEPVAVLRLDFQDNQTFVYDVYVDEDKRGNGLGTILMKHFINDYFDENHKPLMLHVTDSNAAAYKLYRKCGFIINEAIYNYSLLRPF